MSVTTSRFVLERVRLDHADAVYAIRSYPEVYKWTMSGRWSSRQESVDWLAGILEKAQNINFIITLDASSETASSMDVAEVGKLPDGRLVIGSLGIMRDGEIGYMIHPAAWGQGVAPEAVKAALLKYVEENQEAQTVKAHVDATNERSLRMLTRMGFKQIERHPYKSVEMGDQVEVIFGIDREGIIAWEQT